MHSLLCLLRHKCAIGYVSGGPLAKQQQQLGTPTVSVTTIFDFCFAENGVTSFRMGIPLPGSSFIQQVGEAKYEAFVSWALEYINNLNIPIKRGPLFELRNGNVNFSPIGQGVSYAEMEEIQRYDKAHGIRKTMIEALETRFSNLELKYAIGGQTCFDVFPVGWDKTYCLRHVEAEKERSGIVYNEIHFFGDKVYEGGNDFELYEDERTIGHLVTGPEDTMRQIRELFDL
jgi:phosphomannomutase